MNHSIPERLSELDNEIATHRENMKKILDEVGWTAEKLTSSEKMARCTNNHHHYVPASNLKKHLTSCKKIPPLLTTEEKLHLYEESVQLNQSGIKVPELLHSLQSSPTSLTQTTQKNDNTFIEVLQQQRDLKRRRVAYRKKASYTGKKNNTEKMRDLIESMMESLEDDPKNPQDSQEK